MSHARDRILAVLTDPGFEFMQSAYVADQLMVIVRDTVAEGFDTAADIFDHPDLTGPTAVKLLRRYADDARAHNDLPEV